MPISDSDLIARVEEAQAAAEAEKPNEATTEQPNDDTSHVKSFSEFADEQNEANQEEDDTQDVEANSDEGVGGTDDSDDSDAEADTQATDNQSFTLKVDGEEKTVTLEELLKGYGTNTAAQKKFNDAAHARKQAEEFINQLKTDPWKVLSNPELGLDPRALAEGYLTQELQYEQLTPEQKELQAAKQQLHQFEQERRAQEQQVHEAQLAELTEKYNQEYTLRINTALEESNLPNTEASIRRLAGYMSEALSSEDPKIHNLSDADLCELVREDYQNDFKMMFSETDAETLQKFLGDDMATKLRQSDIKKITGKAPTATKKPVKGNKNAKKKTAEKISTDQFHAYLDSL